MLAGETTHPTDHPGSKVQGQAKPAVISSSVLPENKATSKAEYTNTKQSLPANEYT